MSGKQVDLGPMAMPLGDDGTDQPRVMPANRLDVQRLNQLLANGRQQKNESNTFLSDEIDTNLMIPAEFAIAEADALIQLTETMSEMPNRSIFINIRSVQLQLNAELLPDTTLTAYESAGRLHFEIRVSDSTSQSWLSSKLPWLVCQIGEKLGQPIRVSILASTSGEWHGVIFDWPEGATK